MNKKSQNWLGKAIITIIILGFIAWYIQNGISKRPIVGYRLNDCPKEIFVGTPPTVSLGIYNSGDTDASVILHFIGENILIMNSTKKPYNTINANNVYVDFTILKNTPTLYYGENILFTVNDTIDNFSYSYEVIKNTDKSVSGNINQFFGEIKGFYPTVCNYKKESQFKFINIE